MKVKINRDVCPAHLAFCERCLGQFLKYPLGYERRCFEEFREDVFEGLTGDDLSCDLSSQRGSKDQPIMRVLPLDQDEGEILL